MDAKVQKFNQQYGEYSHAASELTGAMSIAKTNLPYNRREGKLGQAKLEERAITSYKAALDKLKEAAGR